MSISQSSLLGEKAREHPFPDAEIIRRVLGGETALFEVLMRRCNRKLYRSVRAVLTSEAEVEDVMQQAYVSAYRHLDQFSGAALFSTWVIRIAVHEAFARLRRQARFADDGGEVLMERIPSRDRSPEQQVANRQLGDLIEQAIDGLAPIYRAVFVLREIEGLPVADTAECLGISPEAVKVRLHRARQRLRADLDARIGGAAAEVFPFHDPRCNRVVENVFAALRDAAGPVALLRGRRTPPGRTPSTTRAIPTGVPIPSAASGTECSSETRRPPVGSSLRDDPWHRGAGRIQNDRGYLKRIG